MMSADEFAQLCRDHGLSVTVQRIAIFEALAATKEHPSAEQIHRAVRRRLPSLSLATVYKNLESLKKIGAIADVNPLHEEGRYEAVGHTPHHHLVCVSCKKVRDVYDRGLDRLRLADAQGFDVRAVRVQAEGLCPECQARERRPRKRG